MKKKRTVIISGLVVLALLLAGGYLWIKYDVPELDFDYANTDPGNVDASWRLDRDGTVTVYGDGRLTWFSAEYNGRLLELEQNGSFYAYLKWNLGKAYDRFPAKRMIIKEGATELMVPEDELASYSFLSCHRLREIIVDESNPYFSSEDGVLFNKDKTVLLKYPEDKKDKTYTVPDGVTEIAAEAFMGKRHLTSVVLPESLTKIGYDAFLGRPRRFRLVCADDNEIVRQYAEHYGITLETGGTLE